MAVQPDEGVRTTRLLVDHYTGSTAEAASAHAIYIIVATLVHH